MRPIGQAVRHQVGGQLVGDLLLERQGAAQAEAKGLHLEEIWPWTAHMLLEAVTGAGVVLKALLGQGKGTQCGCYSRMERTMPCEGQDSCTRNPCSRCISMLKW